MARTIQDILKDADEAPRGPGKDSGRGRRTAGKGRDAALGDGTGTPNSGKYRQRTDRQGVARGQGIDTRSRDPLFRDAMVAIDKMGRKS